MSTLAQLRDQVALKISDPNHYEVSEANLTIMVNEAIRDVVKDGELNQAEILVEVTLVAETPTPAIVAPADLDDLVAYADWGGLVSFTISDCLILHKVVRHISVQDGKRTPLTEVSAEMIDTAGLIGGNYTKLTAYRIIAGPVFQFVVYPPLSDGGYPYRLDIPYLRIPTALVHTTDDAESPEIPEIYHDVIATRAAFLALKASGKMSQAAVEQGEYYRAMAVAKGQMGSDNIRPKMARRRRRIC
jgi:hypothetical protein